MIGLVKGMVLGVVAGAAADMALRTAQGRRTAAGKAMQAVTDAVDSAAASVKHTMGRERAARTARPTRMAGLFRRGFAGPLRPFKAEGGFPLCSPGAGLLLPVCAGFACRRGGQGGN